MHLCSFLRGSKPVSSTASTVPMIGPNVGSEHGELVPEQRSSFSLFGRGNVETEQSIQPQQTVCENVFGMLEDVPQGDGSLQDGGPNRARNTSGGPPNGGPTHGGHPWDDTQIGITTLCQTDYVI